ncbi:MAG TPA: hypothetical protein VFI28_05265 [Candidatus Limnocylindrales bacterium]|nr:hypothetical protein [Candidatus Limnocylindrales bacterium]
MNPSTRRGRATTPPSAGLEEPGSHAGSTERIAELEDRLARLERRVTLRDRSRTMMAKVMPPEASEHFRQAGRHQLLGLRSIIDFWIDRVDRAAPAGGANAAERIDIE